MQLNKLINKKMLLSILRKNIRKDVFNNGSMNMVKSLFSKKYRLDVKSKLN
jgi:hypothetical protein